MAITRNNANKSTTKAKAKPKLKVTATTGIDLETRRMVLSETGDVAGFVDRLMEVHATITKYFFTCIGMELMTVDGTIMLAIMRAFRDAGKPALPIHDSVVCRASDADFTRETMEDEYRFHTQYPAAIKRVF